ncbi:MAG: hypothetical protein AAF348_07480 [Bacteroidota bacterium]
MADGRITGQGLVEDSAFKVFERLDQEVVSNIKRVNELEKAIRNAISSGSLSSASSNSVTAIRNANKGLTEQEKVYRQIAIAKERNTNVTRDSLRQLVDERTKRNQLNAELRQESRLNNSLEGSYQRLRLERDKAARTLRDLVVSEKASNRELRNAQREFNTLDGRVKKADTSIRNFRDNVGNYQSALRPAIGALRELVGVFGIVQGIRLAFDFAKEASELARQAKGVEFAFDRLGEQGVKAFNDVKQASRGALSDLDIQTSLNELSNFNIDLEQAGVLFEFLTVRALQTGQSIDKLQDSLVEGLSKESLLRIDNLGISAGELNAELQKTPNFVEAVANVARREVAEAGDIIDQAGNSQERFNASLENAQKTLGQLLQSDGLNFFRILGTQIDRIEKGMKSFSVGLETAQRGLNNFLSPIKELIQDIPFLNSAITKTVDFLGDFFEILTTPSLSIFGIALRRLGATLSGLGSAFTATKDEAIDFIRTLASFGDIEFSLNPAENFRNIQNFFSNAKNQFVQGGRDIAKAFNEGYNNALLSSTDNGQDPIDVLNTSTKELTESTKDLTPEVQKLANTFEIEFKKAEQSAERVREALKKTLESAGLEITSLSPDDINADLIKRGEGLEKLKNDTKISSDELKEIYNGLFTTFANFYQLDLNAFENLLAGKEVSFNDYANFAASLGESILQGQLIRYENEITANQEKLNAILDSDEATDKQKIAAQKKFDEQQRQIRIRQAQAERTATLIQIGIDTAAAIAKVLAQTGVVAPTLIPVIAAIGAAQAAFVASQPLPQFFQGKNAMDSYEGPATWGERRKEVKIGSDGNIEVSPNRTTPLYVKKDDIITPSIEDFQRHMNRPSSEVFKRVSRSLQNESDSRTGFVIMNSSNIDTTKLEKTMERVMRKYANRPVNVRAKVEDTRRVKSYL